LPAQAHRPRRPRSLGAAAAGRRRPRNRPPRSPRRPQPSPQPHELPHQLFRPGHVRL